MKKALACILAAALCLSMSAPAFAANTSFTDVPASHWANAAISEMAERGVVRGDGGGRFAPDKSVTSAEFSVMLCNLFFSKELAAYDGDTDYWWMPAMNTADEAGAIERTTAWQYCEKGIWDVEIVEAPMNRFDMAQAMYSTLKAKGVEMPGAAELTAAQKQIPDFAETPYFYQDAVSAMYSMGLLSGVDATGNFNGTGEMTRAAACIALSNMAAQVEGTAKTPEKPAESEQPVETEKPAETETPVQPEVTEEPASETSELDAMREAMLAIINAERAKEGASALKLDDKLCEAAQIRANELPELFEHTRPDGTACFTVFKEVKFTSYTTAGENIACGQPTVESVMNSWMNSPGHRANILNPDFSKIGIGLIQTGSGYSYYWVQMFAG